MKILVPPHSGQAVNESQRQALLEVARSLVGVRWQHMGRSRQGLDCAGLLILVVYEVIGAWVEVSDYSPWPNERVMREMCNLILLPIKREDLAPGDAALLYTRGLGVVHLGFYTGRTLIHANNAAGIMKVVENRIHPDWHLRGTYAVPQFTGG